MLKRSAFLFHYWSSYDFGANSPKLENPAPVGAPQNFNTTSEEPAINQQETQFPVSIRGGYTFPDVPEENYAVTWYAGYKTGFEDKELTSWVASAPPNAYRFRPFNEFEEYGRNFVENMRKFTRKPAHQDPNDISFREAYLTKMNTDAKTPPQSLLTLMNRAVSSDFKRTPSRSVLAEQRDVGRIEPFPKCAGKIKPDASVFPFCWKTEDWYDYEVAKVRTRRFRMENESGLKDGSEVTYKLFIESQWDKHAEKMAEDVAEFIKEVGKEIVEERLAGVRKSKAALLTGRPVDSEIIEHLPPEYTNEEAADFVLRELDIIEQQCLSIVAKCSGQPSVKERYEKNMAWPYVKNLEPWVRMVQYWNAMGDRHFTHMEKSVLKMEFKKFYRIVVVKMPFVSLELEKRILDIRHWAHRASNLEFQIIYRGNVVYDRSLFPVEHDPITPPSHENHRLFSFALDWQEGPASMSTIEPIRTGDSWGTIAARLGTTIRSLQQANPGVEELIPRETLGIPVDATKVRTASGSDLPQMTLFVNENRLFNTWEDVAKVLDCEVSDLQEVNLEHCNEKGELVLDVKQISVPLATFVTIAEEQFARNEYVLCNDTWESISKRLGCSVEDLKKVNPASSTNEVRGECDDREVLVKGRLINVPATAKRARRINDPMLLVDASRAVTNRMRKEMKQFNLLNGIPIKPDNAEKFSYEFMDSMSMTYPKVPQHIGTEDWLAYTSAYLDRDLSQKGMPTPLYNTNQLWPMYQVPGRVDQTPFEEDQTWHTHHIPLQQMEMFHPEGYLQDLPEINNEATYSKSLDWQAP